MGQRGRKGGTRGPRCLVSQPERPGFSAVALPRAKVEGSGRPFEEAQTRRASEARPSIVAGANGRVSETQRLSGGGTSSKPGRHECGGFAKAQPRTKEKRSRNKSRRSQDAGKKPDFLAFMVVVSGMDNFWSVILGAFVAICSGVATPFFLEKSKRRAERLSLTGAIVGEVQALIEISRHRKYIEGIRQELTKAQTNPDKYGIFHFSVRRNPMRVYESNLTRIGLLPDPLPKQIVSFYAGISSILEDIEDMREGKIQRTPEDRIRVLNELLQLMEATLALGEGIIASAGRK